MKTVNTVDLKNQTNRLLRHVRRGEPIVVTYRGKAAAALIPLREDEIDDLVLQYSPAFRELIAEAEADIRAGRLVSWGEFLAHERRTKTA